MRDAIVEVGFAAAADLTEWPKFFQMVLGVDNVMADPEPDRVWETNNMVDYFTPSERQLDTMLAVVRDWLTKANIAHRVRLVTICRSVRDGYLPRRLQPYIEHHLIRTLDDMFPNIDVTKAMARPSW